MENFYENCFADTRLEKRGKKNHVRYVEQKNCSY